MTNADGALLLVRRSVDPWRGHWDIPGGFCEEDELPADAAVREVFEETGLRVETLGLVGMWIDRYGGGAGVDVTLNCYFAARPVGEIRLTIDPAESSDARWFAAEALPAEVAFPDHARQVLETWRSGGAAAP